MDILHFLIEAKLNTYASSGEGGETKLKDGSHQFIYSAGEYKYRDRYYGYNPFAGEEVVFQSGTPIWAMNYYGKIAPLVRPVEEVYAWLRKALSYIPEGAPFRGPKIFSDNLFRYTNVWEGDVESFFGTERISWCESGLYCLHYHGGTLVPQDFTFSDLGKILLKE